MLLTRDGKTVSNIRLGGGESDNGLHALTAGWPARLPDLSLTDEACDGDLLTLVELLVGNSMSNSRKLRYRQFAGAIVNATVRRCVLRASIPLVRKVARADHSTGRSWRAGYRACIAIAAMAVVLAPGLAISCAVTTPMPREALDTAARLEAEAWLNSKAAWVAIVTSIVETPGGNPDRFRLTPTLVLQGASPPELVLPAQYMNYDRCRYYRGLDRGAELGSEFIIYSHSDRPDAASVLVVSTAQVGDPASRLAIDSARAAAFRASQR